MNPTEAQSWLIVAASVIGTIIGSAIIAMRSNKVVKADVQSTMQGVRDDVESNYTETLDFIKDINKRMAESSQKTNDDLRLDVAQQREMLANQSKQLTAVLESQNQIVKNNALIRQENAELKRDIDNWKQTVETVQADNLAIRAELAHQKNYSAHLEESLATAKAAYDGTINKQSNDLAEKNAQLDEANRQLQEALSVVATLKTRIEHLEQREKELTARVGILETTLHATELNVAQAQAERDEARRERDMYKKQYESATAEIAVLRQQVDRLTGMVDNLREQVALKPVVEPPVTPVTGEGALQ